MSVINTNVNAVLAQNSLVKNERAMSAAMEQLSTGKRINSAADDAAGLAIASKMTAQIRGLDQAVRNINDAVSMVQTAEGATGEITNMLQRMRELAVQTNSGTYTAADKANIELEFQALLTGIDNIADTTQWNSMNILDGTGSSTVFQIGANDSQTVRVNLGNLQSNAYTVGAAGSVVINTNATEVANLTSAKVGDVTVALSGLTSTSGLVTALNADATFAASYTAVETTSGSQVTITEKTGAFSNTGPTVTLAGANAGPGWSTLTITDNEANTLLTFVAGSVSVSSAALGAATTVAGVVSALNASSAFAASYSASAVTGGLKIAQVGAATTTAGPTVTTTATPAFTGTGNVVGATSASGDLRSKNTYTISDAQAQTLTQIIFTAASGSGASASATVAVSGSSNIATLTATLNADATFAATFSATAVTGGIKIIASSTNTQSGAGVTISTPTSTSFTSSSSNNVKTAGNVATTATVATGTQSANGLGANISALTSTTTSVLTTLDTALAAVATQNATNGATINRLEYTADSLANVSLNTQASRSRIEDADYAKATTELARTQIIQQAGTAMLAQANQQSQGVLALLQ